VAAIAVLGLWRKNRRASPKIRETNGMGFPDSTPAAGTVYAVSRLGRLLAGAARLRADPIATLRHE